MSQTLERLHTFITQCRPWQLIVLSSTIVFGMLYIWQVNTAAAHGFTMRDLERDIQAFAIEQERYQLEVARLQSIESITQRVQMLGLTKVEKVEFVEVVEPTVAVK